MKNLVKKTCVLASALMVGGVSNASIYQRNSVSSYNSNSDVSLDALAYALSLILSSGELLLDKKTPFISKALAAGILWGGLEIAGQSLGLGSFTKKFWNTLGAVITPSKDGKYADVEFDKNGKTVKIRIKIIYSGNQNILIPVQYNQQPRNFGLSQNDYNNCLSQSFPQHMAQYDYSQIVSQDPDLPTLEEIEKAKLYANNNMPAPEAGTEGNNDYYPNFD